MSRNLEFLEEFNDHSNENITNAIEEGCKPCTYDGLSVPIAMTSIFQCRTQNNEYPSGYVYTRVGNPTVEIVEKQINKLYNLRNPKDRRPNLTLSFPSGMAAVSSTLFCLVEKDAHVLVSSEVYCRVYKVLEHLKKYANVDFDVVDIMGDMEILKKKIRKGKTKFLFFDSCSNPSMRIPDFPVLVNTVKECDPLIQLICDNSWLTSILFNPFEYGIDIVLESGSKYLSGSSSTIFGFVTVKDSGLYLNLNRWRSTHGHAVHPMASYMISKGIDTLEMRMKEISRRGQIIAEFLDNLPCVGRCLYPTLKSHFHYRRGKKFFSGGSGVIFFHVAAGLPLVEELISYTQLVIKSTSYGSSHFLWDTRPKTGFSNENDLANESSVCCDEKDDRSKKRIKGCWLRFAIGFSNLKDIEVELMSAFGRCCGLRLGNVKKINFKKNSIEVIHSTIQKFPKPVFSLLEIHNTKEACLEDGDWIFLANDERTNFQVYRLVKVLKGKPLEIQIEPKIQKNVENFTLCLKLKNWKN